MTASPSSRRLGPLRWTPVRYRVAWAAAIPVLWALGWTLTTLAGVDVDKQYTIFGSAGAVTFSALSGALLHRLLPARTTTTPIERGSFISKGG
jgi:hypothetical protein